MRQKAFGAVYPGRRCVSGKQYIEEHNNSRLGQDACWVLTGQVEKGRKEARVQWEGVGAFSWEHRSGPGM